MTATLKSPGLIEGERRKERKLSVLAARRELYVMRGRRALLTKLIDDDAATTDIVRDAVTLPKELDPKLFGAVPGPLAMAGIIRADGFAKTCRPKAHARPVTVWRLVDRAKAEQWLTDHPDRSDDVPAVSQPSHTTNAQRTLFDGGEGE